MLKCPAHIGKKFRKPKVIGFLIRASKIYVLLIRLRRLTQTLKYALVIHVPTVSVVDHKSILPLRPDNSIIIQIVSRW